MNVGEWFMHELWKILLITAIAGVGGTGMGGVISLFIRRDSKKIVSLFLSFAAGVMLAVVCFDLLQDAIFPAGGEESNLLIAIIGVLVGFSMIALLNFWIDSKTNHEIKHIDEEHPRTADDLDELTHYNHYQVHKEENRQLFLAGIIMALAIALHNLPEGMVIGAAYAADSSQYGGILIAMVIGLHNIPEGMAIAVPLISGGEDKAHAVLLTALSGAPTILGAALGYWLGEMGPLMLTISLSFASGAMLYVVFGELLPESILMQKSKWPALAAVVGILVGIMIIYA